MYWTNERPSQPCAFVTATRHGGQTDYSAWEIIMHEGRITLTDQEGCEWGALEDLNADYYLVLPKINIDNIK